MKKQIWTRDEQSRFMNCSGNHGKVHCLAFARVSVSFKGSKVKRQEYFRFTLFFTYHIIIYHIIMLFLAHMKSTRGRLCSQKPFITPLPYVLSWFGSMCWETRNSHRTWGLSLDFKHSGRVASLRRVIVLGVTTKCSHTKRIYLAKTTKQRFDDLQFYAWYLDTMILGSQDKDAGNKFMHKRSCGLSHCKVWASMGYLRSVNPWSKGSQQHPFLVVK